MTYDFQALLSEPGPLSPSILDRFAGLLGALDQALSKLDHDGLIAPHQPCDGEEATLAGAAAALLDRDWAFWGSQVCAPALLRGIPPEALIANALTASEAAALAAKRIVVCTQGPATRLPHAVGLAWAARNDGVCALVEIGDGALADGDVHVGLNFAAVMHAPVVFVVRSDGSRPVAERGEGYGLASVVVDGHQANLVRDAVASALDRARRGEGPCLIEARVRRGTPLPPGRLSEHDDAVAAALEAALRRAPSHAPVVHPVVVPSPQSSQRPS